MNLLHGLKLREKVLIRGVPIVWSTNLSDEDIRSLYLKLEIDRGFVSFLGRKEGVDGARGLALSIKIFSRAINFKEGCCQCFGVGNRLCVIYRSTEEWELLDAREREIRELRDEQRRELEVEELVFKNEDDHLSVKLAECLTNKEYSEATRLLSLRVELREENPKIKRYLVSRGGLLGEAIKTFCNFPQTDEGIRFILEHFPWSWALFGFARRYYSSCSYSRKDLMIEIDKIFRAIIEQFPDDARMHKMICLFWEREGELQRAIEYCGIGVSRSLKDGTVNGFLGRLKRLENKQRRKGQPIRPESRAGPT